MPEMPNQPLVEPVVNPADEQLSPLAKFTKYVQASIPLQRLVHVKMLTDTARSLPEQHMEDHDEEKHCQTRNSILRENIASLLPGIAQDTEFVIRQAYAQEAAVFAQFLVSTDNMSLLLDTVLVTIHQLLLDATQEVRDASSNTLVTITDLLQQHDPALTLQHVLSPVLEVARSGEDDDHKTTAIATLSRLAGILEGKVLLEHVVPLLATLAQDSSFRVRKACGQYFGGVCEALDSSSVLQHMLRPYELLSKDPIWSVRKGCVGSLVQMARSIDRETRGQVFVGMMMRLVQDVSRWVRNAAYKELGPFIHVLESELVSTEFLRLYAQIPFLSNTLVDSEINYFCAFNFPAVCLRVGAGRWPELSSAYSKLCKDTKFKVRRTLAHSLHEMAQILGSPLTTLHLLPVLDTFLKDLDEVRVGVVAHLAKFLAVLPAADRLAHLDTLHDLQRESDQNWRFRGLLAEQLHEFVHVFEEEVIASDLVPILLGLARDRISAVRKVVLPQFGVFLRRLRSHGSYDELVGEIQRFARSTTFLERQIYLRVCVHGLLKDMDVEDMAHDFLPLFLGLGLDPVVNVRIVFARSLSELYGDERYRSMECVREAAEGVCADEVTRVYFAYADECGSVQESGTAEGGVEEIVQSIPQSLVV